MATFTAYQQYDTNNINELADPISKSFFAGGAIATDCVGAYAIVIGDNLGLDSYGNLTGNPSEFTQYTRQGDAYFGVSNLDINIDNNSYNAGYAVGSQTLYGFQAEIAYWLRGNDSVRGSSLGDVISGFAGNDVLDGGTGDDTLSGGPGSDSIHGGAGKDTALFTGKFSDYTVTLQSNGHTNIVDKVSGRDGGDVLDGVERVKFSDTSVALDVGKGQNAGEIYRLYEAAFDRAPKPVGEGYWLKKLDNGETLVDIANEFTATTEFQKVYGGSAPEYTVYVTEVFQHVLGRAPKQAGLDYWSAKLVNGESYGAVLAGISESDEKIANVATLITNGIQYTDAG